MNRRPYVVAIAAVSGGGKTTITEQLSRRLLHSRALYFDDYEFDSCPDDICDWARRGADYNEWDLTPLIKDIEALMRDSGDCPGYILLDYPFAYLHSALSKYIDFAVYIDTPLDIAMARRIERDYASKSMNDLLRDLQHYVSRGRAAYQLMEKTVKPASDLLVDGSLPVAAIVEQVLGEIDRRLADPEHR